MTSKDIDTVTDEDIARWKAMDFSKAKRAHEIPWIKAYQEKKGIRKPGVPRKSVRLKIDTDILAWLKEEGGRYYQVRMNAILREEMEKDLQSAKTDTGAEQ